MVNFSFDMVLFYKDYETILSLKGFYFNSYPLKEVTKFTSSIKINLDNLFSIRFNFYSYLPPYI